MSGNKHFITVLRNLVSNRLREMLEEFIHDITCFNILRLTADSSMLNFVPVEISFGSIEVFTLSHFSPIDPSIQLQ